MDTEIIVARAEMALEQDGKELNWDGPEEMERVVNMIKDWCEAHDYDVCKSSITWLYRNFDRNWLAS